MPSKKEILVKKTKKFVKNILGINYTIRRNDFNRENSCEALDNLIEYRKDLLDERKSAGVRRDGKDFYPDVKKIADAFSFYRIKLHEYDKNIKNIKEINGYDNFDSGTPMRTNPFPMCLSEVKKMLKRKNIHCYPATSGEVIPRERFLEYLAREGFELNKSDGYDGMGVDNVVFTCSTTAAYSMIVNLISRPEDVILITGPNYGFFALEPERLNARIEILKLEEEDNWYVNPEKLEKRIEQINKKLKKEFNGKLDYIPRVVGFLNMNPHNPIGNVMGIKEKDLLYKIGDVCLKKGVFVIDDLIYRDLTFNRDNIALPLATNKKYFNNTISLFGLSKSYGLASFRAGAIVAPIPICKGISQMIFELMDSTPFPQVEAMVGAYNATNKRYKEYKKYFNPIIEEYKYRYQLFKAITEGIDVIKDDFIKQKIKKDIYKYQPNQEIRNMLLKGIPNVSIRKGTEPQSGFFSVMDFTKLKGKKYANKVINNDEDMLEYLYIKGKIVWIMGESMSWPNEDEIIGRINFGISKKALVENMSIITKAVRELK